MAPRPEDPPAPADQLPANPPPADQPPRDQPSADLLPVGPASADPLDIPQTFEPATSPQVRDALADLVRRDLLGPWAGPDEELPGGSAGPRDRYLVGMLGPRPGPASAGVESVEADPGTSGDAQDPEPPEIVAPGALGRIWASSLGLSFTVPHDVPAVTVVAEWGEYAQRLPEPPGDGPERPGRVWVREPRRFERLIDLTGPATARLGLLDEDPQVPGVVLRVEVRARNGQRVVEITMINTQGEPETSADTAWLFQTGLTVTAPDGVTPVFLPVDDPLDTLPTGTTDGQPAGPAGDPSGGEDAHLRLLYRGMRRYATGRNVAVHARVPHGSRCADRLETTWVPVHDVPQTVAPDDDPHLAATELGMDALSTLPVTDLRGGLTPLVAGYGRWLDAQDTRCADLPGPLRGTAVAAVGTARRLAERIAAGIDLITDPFAPGHEEALVAFRFANRAMADQRRSTALARLRAEEKLGFVEASARIAARGPAAARWRPFQLAFVLLNLPALTDPAHPDRAPDPSATVDLLFFPTGGGKTEAYLGLAAYTFAIRRLQGVVGSGEQARDGSAGVAVLMRYTLRLLTAQQFQRAAALVCAAELIRREDVATWGTEPFRIGLWVGGAVSPNWFTAAHRQISDAKDSGDGSRANVLQTVTCPWCGTLLTASRDVDADEQDRRIRLFCPRGEGPDRCPFSRRADPEGLPVLTVDEEIYRYAPTLVIATVDKLAQLPWKGYAGILFGRVSSRCTRHGYRHADLDERTGCRSQRHRATGRLPAAQTVPVGRLRPPDLIIQDELHLISGSLGTTVGLFEAAVDELCSWTLTGPLPVSADESTDAAGGTVGGAGAADPGYPRRVSAKIVASTATTRRAAEQVLGVFARGLSIFPPQVIDVTDTYFSRQLPVTERTPGRRYLGLCAHGVRFKSAQIRLAEILMLAGQALLDRHGSSADPYLTLVGYYNATRELAGMRRYLDDDVAVRLRAHGARRGLPNRLRGSELLTVQELTSRISSGDISEVLRRLELQFEAELDTTPRKKAVADDMRRAMNERGRSGSRGAAAARGTPGSDLHPLARRYYDRRDDGTRPVDVVLATSMLQVGVDVSRFGLMLVTGQPKNTAEYIQATSRVGRDPNRPGLVVTLYNWARPRDLAHFEDFEHYHATFYRQVEALSVTPFTRRSLDRTAASTLVAAVRNGHEHHSRNLDAQDVALRESPVEELIQRMLDRAGAVGGGRGREYLAERLDVVLDAWARHTGGASHLVYDSDVGRGHAAAGLLRRPGNGPWGTLTAALSMRETESDLNLLVPAGQHLYAPTLDVPDWTFAPPQQDPDEDSSGTGSGDSNSNGSAGNGTDQDTPRTKDS